MKSKAAVPKIGQMKHRITVLDVVESVGADGTVTQEWEEFAEVAAAIEMIRGQWYAAGGQKEATAATLTVKIRYLDGLNQRMRFTWNGNTYMLVMEPIDILADQRWMEVLANRVV